MKASRAFGHGRTPGEISLLKQNLIDRAESVCRHLLPSGSRNGNQWFCGDLRGNPGRSLAISLTTGKWIDFATGEKGSNLLELWRQVRNIDFGTALNEAGSFYGGPTPRLHDQIDERKHFRARWPAFETGSRNDLQSVAKLRRLPVEGIELASKRGLLHFADWRGFPCWIVADALRTNAQARRMDGQPFVVQGKCRKAITLPGSRAGVPIGLVEAKVFSAVAVVEGGPDLLAAHSCMWSENRNDVAAVAVLGALHRPTSTVWSALAGKRVRIYCHRDDSGMSAGKAWGEAIVEAGCIKIDGYRFDDMRKFDGSDVTDLNDMFALHPDDFAVRRDAWEILP